MRIVQIDKTPNVISCALVQVEGFEGQAEG